MTKSTTRDHSDKHDMDIEEFIFQGAVPKHVIESLRCEGTKLMVHLLETQSVLNT